MTFIPTGFTQGDDDLLGHAMYMVGMWEREFGRLNKLRKKYNISDTKWGDLRKKAKENHSNTTPFLSNLKILIQVKRK